MKEKLKAVEKVVENLFREIGLCEEIQIFLKSDEVNQIICETQKKLLEKMAQIEKNALNESDKEVAKKLRSRFALNGQEELKENVYVIYQAFLYFCVQVMIENDSYKEQVLTLAVKAIKEYGRDDIKRICQNIYEQESDKFMRRIYQKNISEELPEKISDLLSKLAAIAIPC